MTFKVRIESQVNSFSSIVENDHIVWHLKLYCMSVMLKRHHAITSKPKTQNTSTKKKRIHSHFNKRKKKMIHKPYAIANYTFLVFLTRKKLYYLLRRHDFD